MCGEGVQLKPSPGKFLEACSAGDCAFEILGPLFSCIKGMGGCGECTQAGRPRPTIRQVFISTPESPPQANVPECTRMYPNVPECTPIFVRMYLTMVSGTVGKLQGSGGVAVVVPAR